MASSTTPLVHQIRSLTTPVNSDELKSQVQKHLDESFGDIDILLATANAIQRAGPSKRRRRNLDDEIVYWEQKEARAQAELDQTTTTLPIALEEAQRKLQDLLSSAQDLSLKRYSLADKLANLVEEISPTSNSIPDDDNERATRDGERETILLKMEKLGEELSQLEAGLAWTTLLGRVTILSENTLDTSSYRPSPLAALPHYRELHELVTKLEESLPGDMALLKLVLEVKDRTWTGLKDIMSRNLLAASEALGWPRKVLYHTVPAASRRTFEHAFQDLLYLQAEGEILHTHARPLHWSSGNGLYPLQALVQPIELRFKYHFQGTKGTNRVDKPEWAFANILDQIYEHQSFVNDYLQPLTIKAGHENVEVKSEFTLLLFPTLLSLLRSRIPRLLDHPALLAHTIYQTVVFDDAIKEGGFDFDAVSVNEGVENAPWEGLTGVILREADWFARWLGGEKKFSDGQFNDIISSPDAWTISDESPEAEDGHTAGLRPTISARQVKALIEQIIDRYSPLPELEYKLPFLLSLQLPLLSAYHSRISGSLDAFETLSSAFVRAVPGALSGNTRSGAHIDQAKLTSGPAGLERLIKAWLSAKWVLEALRKWADDLFFVEMSSELRAASTLRWKFQSDSLLPTGITLPSLSTMEVDGTISVFDVLIERYTALLARGEDMIVRLVTVEVENDLKQHLTRRWDQLSTTTQIEPSSSFLQSLTTYSTHLKILHGSFPEIYTYRIYRRIVNHLTNHISQRAVYSGWSKFSQRGGEEFAQEINEWKDVSLSTLITGSTRSDQGEILTENIVLKPWEKLLNYSKILATPSNTIVDDGNGNNGKPTFPQAMAAAWSDGEISSKNYLDRLNIKDMRKEELQSLLRRRGECWR